jgi:SAM-dependent methyltransferase
MSVPSTVELTRAPVGSDVLARDPAGAAAWRNVPVFIVNRNRFEPLSRLVDWLVNAGMRRIVVLDNDSDFAPLLEYYDRLPETVKVLRLGENHGPYVLWQQGVHHVLDTPYVVTDSDVVPAPGCPMDLVGALLDCLRRYPDAKKVGAALRIDNLPQHYVEVDTVRKWESQFWEHPIAPGIFAAPVDTTFAIYPAGGEFSNEPCNLRLGHPYVAEHTPWYADERDLTEEERYYRDHTSATFSNWSVGKKDSWVRRSQRVAEFERRPRVLHLDAGRQYVPGWINAGCGTGRFDVAFDASRSRQQPLALDDHSVDGIHLSHVLGRVRDAQALFEELYRVAKPNAKLVLRAAYGGRDDAWDDPLQEAVWNENSLARFAQPPHPAAAAYRGDWRVVEVRLVRDPSCNEIADGVHARDIIAEMVVTMVAVKPARGRRGVRPIDTVQPVLVADARLDPAFATV